MTMRFERVCALPKTGFALRAVLTPRHKDLETGLEPGSSPLRSTEIFDAGGDLLQTFSGTVSGVRIGVEPL
jgi:hypothetical protein